MIIKKKKKIKFSESDTDSFDELDESDELYEISKEECILNMFDNINSIRKKIIIKDCDKITSNKATKYEITRALTYSIKQIENGSVTFIN